MIIRGLQIKYVPVEFYNLKHTKVLNILLVLKSKLGSNDYDSYFIYFN